MNYLAHLYLSDGTPESMLGGLLADFVRSDEGYSPGIRAGIALHRQIDAFTNEHPTFIQSKRRIEPRWRHYREILIDLFYDHFLAVKWTHYSKLPLAEYAGAVYATLQEHGALLPPHMQLKMNQMRQENWLLAYREVAGIERALGRIGLRLNRRVELNRAVEALEKNYDSLGSDFDTFFPELKAFACKQH